MKLLHFSDLHLEDGLSTSGLGAFGNKRALGFTNLVLRRRAHFGRAREKVEALTRFADEESVDVALCTGDFTALGTAPELEAAARLTHRLRARPLGQVIVPGNHDLYVDDGADAHFRTLFADGLSTDRPGGSQPLDLPIVRTFPGVTILGLGSARPNPLHRSSGRVPDAQLRWLRDVVAEPRTGRYLLVALHYAPRLWDGRPDTALHGLENHEALLEVLRDVPRCAIVFGHIHHGYVVRLPGVSPVLVGAGSATYEGRESAVLWTFDDGRVEATKLEFAEGRFRRAETFVERH